MMKKNENSGIDGWTSAPTLDEVMQRDGDDNDPFRMDNEDNNDVYNDHDNHTFPSTSIPTYQLSRLSIPDEEVSDIFFDEEDIEFLLGASVVTGLEDAQESSTSISGPLILSGKDIIPRLPGALHFICGCANFDPVDNRQFMNLVVEHFTQRLSDLEFQNIIRTQYRVAQEVESILEKAKYLPLMDQDRQSGRTVDVRIWKVAIKNTSLRKKTWESIDFRDITSDMDLLRKELRQPLRAELVKLHTNCTNSRTGRILARKKPAPETIPSDGVFSPPVHLASNSTRELNVDEQATTAEICRAINGPGIHVASIFTVDNNAQGCLQANHYFAVKIAMEWQQQQPDRRTLFQIDAKDLAKMTASYKQARDRLLLLASADAMQEDNIDYEEGRAKRYRPSVKDAASEFYEQFLTSFPCHHECVFVYTSVPDPRVFQKGFLPLGWLQNNFCLTTIRAVLLATVHPAYDQDMGAQLGIVTQYAIDWKSEDNNLPTKPWWERSPPSNLPYSTDEVEEPPGIDAKLAIDGKVLGLVGCKEGSCLHADKVALQCVRRWLSVVPENTAPTHRFALWLRANNEKNLRDSYHRAIQNITFSSSAYPIGDPVNLSLQGVADGLMSLLMKLKELSPTGERFVNRQWAMIFSDADTSEPFQNKFFSARSNWFNSNGRFLIASTTDEVYVEAVDFKGKIIVSRVNCLVCQ